MDLNAMLQAAQQDPNAAQFLQQLLAGGTAPTARLPEIQAQQLRAPDIVEMPGSAPLPVFQPAKTAVDDLLGKWSPPAGAGTPMLPGEPQQGPTPGGGTLDQMMADPAAGGALEAPAALGPGTPIPLSPEQQEQQLGQGTMPPQDLSSLLGRMLGLG